MPLNIKDPETDRLARELAAVTGESITVAARRAIEERLDRLRRRQAAALSVDDFSDIIARGRASATFDDRSAEDIIGYDEMGLPQ